MKKLIIIIFAFLPFALQSQTVDTSAWAFKTVGGDGTYRLLENRSTYLGKSAGSVVMPLQFDVNSIDTANWGFMPIGSDGTFRLVYNKETFYGKDSGTVVAQLIYPAGNSTGTATTSSGTATLNKMNGIITSDNFGSSPGRTFEINNSFVKSTSIITVTVQFIDPNDLELATHINQGIVSITDGQFQYKIMGDNDPTFAGEVKIHFTIINP